MPPIQNSKFFLECPAFIGNRLPAALRLRNPFLFIRMPFPRIRRCGPIFPDFAQFAAQVHLLCREPLKIRQIVTRQRALRPLQRSRHLLQQGTALFGPALPAPGAHKVTPIDPVDERLLPAWGAADPRTVAAVPRAAAAVNRPPAAPAAYSAPALAPPAASNPYVGRPQRRSALNGSGTNVPASPRRKPPQHAPAALHNFPKLSPA